MTFRDPCIEKEKMISTFNMIVAKLLMENSHFAAELHPFLNLIFFI